ncbi:DUF599 domain-containing protein [Cephalotus follicularis]|uniref:DUF599 domain-containing protein n=1 Tax=Cephalotus follicularis TaxID=3775 RepID=A0A1Q3C482_CEPFO|nr:DUF599 domain-containing protein [Cephalotus follicularis]
MSFNKQYLDLVLVPSGLLIMFAYHLILLYRYLNLPHTTVIGFENNDKRAWVQRIMQADRGNVGIALTVITSNISATTFFATISLTLSSLIGAWLGTSSTNQVFQSELIYGDTRVITISMKYICLIACFLLAFSCFVQATRNFVHANYLISLPGSDVPVKNVEKAVLRGGDCWSAGLRALYFALVLLPWFFGPIPMFVSSVFMVILLNYLDTNTTPLHQHKFQGIQMVKRVNEQSYEAVVDIEHH